MPLKKRSVLKSPIKDKALKNPGESLEESFRQFCENNILKYMIISGFSIILAALEWWRWYKNAPPSPLVYTIISLCVIMFSFWKIFKSLQTVRQFKLGLEGEKAIGQFLDELRGEELKVLHDIPGESFNLDHVIISTSGIFVIETKTLSKPDRGEAILQYDGTRITKNGYELERNPLIQVRAAAGWLKNILKESTGRDFTVKSVVVFPGWYIQTAEEAKKSDVWVLNPRALPKFITNSRKSLSLEDLHLCNYHLKRYVRVNQ